jgi:hypothetical protein
MNERCRLRLQAMVSSLARGAQTELRLKEPKRTTGAGNQNGAYPGAWEITVQ